MITTLIIIGLICLSIGLYFRGKQYGYYEGFEAGDKHGREWYRSDKLTKGFNQMINDRLK